MLETITTVLTYLGVPFVVSLLGLYLAFLGLLPEIVIEGVSDKSKVFNSESKLIVRNIGKLPARSIKADVEDFNLYVNTNRFTNCSAVGGPAVASRLSSGESSEISISPGINFGDGARIDEFDYKLTLKYFAKLLFFKKAFSKVWKIELKNRADGFYWEIKII